MVVLLIEHAFLTVFTFLMIVLSLDPLRRLLLTILYYRTRHQAPVPPGRFDPLPSVTLQLPIYGAKAVVRRLIDSACRLDYPPGLLEIQVLDDSTDETTQIAREIVDRRRRDGVNIRLVHRDHRDGYKAGALDDALVQVESDFLAVLDSDFVPPPSWLKELIHHFTDPQVGMVQSRWEHLNRGLSLLTELQALSIDAHFKIENQTRNRTGRFFNNNGTAGVWRTATIRDSGGWQRHLAEDAHLSLRAQLRGWRFILVNDVVAPGELPPTMHDFVAQQERWARGLLLVARDLMSSIWRSGHSFAVKVEEAFHLLGEAMASLPLIVLMLAVGPYVMATGALDRHPILYRFNLSLFLTSYAALAFYYWASQRELARGSKVWYAAAFAAVRVGLSLSNGRGILAVLWRRTALRVFHYDVEAFNGSPKYGLQDRQAGGHRAARVRGGPAGEHWIDPLAYVNLTCAAYCAGWAVWSITRGNHLSVAPLVLAAGGFGYVGLAQVSQAWVGRSS